MEIDQWQNHANRVVRVAFDVILLAFCCIECGSWVSVPVWGPDDPVVGFGIGNGFSEGKSKLCGGNYVGSVASALHLYMAILQDSFSHCYGTAQYHAHFASPLKGTMLSDLEFLGPFWPWH